MTPRKGSKLKLITDPILILNYNSAHLNFLPKKRSYWTFLDVPRYSCTSLNIKYQSLTNVKKSRLDKIMKFYGFIANFS